MSKKIRILFFIIIALTFTKAFSQQNATFEVTNDVYKFLINCEQKNYCERLSNVKPYSQKYILRILNQIKETLSEEPDNKVKQSELEIADFYLKQFDYEDGFDFTKVSFKTTKNTSDFPITFLFNNTSDAWVSSGFYNDSSLNSTGFDICHYLNFYSDFGDNVSIKAELYGCGSRMDMKLLGDDYLIGYWWYEDDWNKRELQMPRTIKTYKNYSVLPYSYKKPWEGSIYPATQLNHSGLKGWAFVPSLGFGMYSEIRGSFFDDILNIGIGRNNHDWASMDYGSSLVLNQMASPFLSVDAKLKVIDHVTISTLTGVMEFPNASYINENAWYLWNDDGFKPTDSYYFQNFFSLDMVDIDFDYVHLDFGSGVIWPKRFELGYMFPLINKIVYQNCLGDYDNISIFGDIKFYIPNYGTLWLSGYIDEIDAFKTNIFVKTRCMFAYQAGTRFSLPWIADTSISARYTKIEPYCYTHQAIRKQPWYDYYISESYTNNGKSLGYYLEPNSDELFVRAESNFIPGLQLGLQYQMIRHGTDYGSAQVPGSSIWSEMQSNKRDTLKKYFLHDGAYEWSHILRLDTSYVITSIKVPVKFYSTLGFVYDYFTQSEGGANTKTPYHKINTNEYPVTKGIVASFGIKLFSIEQN